MTTAIARIPGVSASEPSKTKVAGYGATYLELAGPSSVSCPEYYLWQDTPGAPGKAGAGWWIAEPNGFIRTFILDVAGSPVVISARSDRNALNDDIVALREVLDTIVFNDSP